MRILAVDTSTNVATVAVVIDGILEGEYISNKGKTHSQRLMPMIDELLKTLAIKSNDIDAFSAAVGPGSFTGLRIGVTTIKGFGFALNKPVIGINTLDAMAYNLPFCRDIICPMIDARNNQVFTAVYSGQAHSDINGVPTRTSEYMGVPVEELAALLKNTEERVIFLGDAVKLHSEYFKQQLGERAVFAPASVAMPKASSVAQLASIMLAEGKTESAFDLKPFYLRKSQAEREAEKKAAERLAE